MTMEPTVREATVLLHTPIKYEAFGMGFKKMLNFGAQLCWNDVYSVFTKSFCVTMAPTLREVRR